MLYGHYLLSMEEGELLRGVEAFPDVFSSLYDYLPIVEDFRILKRSSVWLGVTRMRLNENESVGLRKLLERLRKLEGDEDVAMQSKLAGGEGNYLFIDSGRKLLKNLERRHCLSHHIQELRRNIHYYAQAYGENLPESI